MHLISSDAQVKIKSAQDFSVRLPNRVLQDPKLIGYIHGKCPTLTLTSSESPETFRVCGAEAADHFRI